LGAIGIVTGGTFMITDYERIFASDTSAMSDLPILLFPIIVFSVSLIISKFYKKIRFTK